MRPLKNTAVSRVQLLTLEPEDRIVIEINDRIPPKHAEDIRLEAADAFGVDKTRIIIVYNATVKVLREAEPPPPPVIVNPGRWP